ncbi:hypothetical protein WEI85_33935 [Actinomycetes bacterium KLBMP 9797]
MAVFIPTDFGVLSPEARLTKIDSECGGDTGRTRAITDAASRVSLGPVLAVVFGPFVNWALGRLRG